MLVYIKTNAHITVIQVQDYVTDSLINRFLPSDVWTTSTSCFSWLQIRCTNISASNYDTN